MRVASSNLVFRSIQKRDLVPFLVSARMVELVDTQDLKSCGHCGRAGSTPAPGTIQNELEFENECDYCFSD